jgi:hypothetical protein
MTEVIRDRFDMAHPPRTSIIKNVKKLSEIAEALRRRKFFPITRLTIIKSLCAGPETAAPFALFLAQRIQNKMRQEKYPKKFRELVDRAITDLESYLTDPTEERKARLSSLWDEMESEQSKYRKIGWNWDRMLKSSDLFVVEQCLSLVLRTWQAPYWAYHAARDYALRYDDRFWSGLTPSSAPIVEEIAGFWRDYYGINE